jgi:AraC-like DNA-binding protein
MKPKFEKVPLTATPFLVKEETFLFLDVPWHFHPEFEIALIETEQGKRHVGSSIEVLESDELILIGPNLPHSWYDSKNGDTKSKKKSSQIIIQFSYDFLGKDFFTKPPFVNILQLLDRAQSGITFYGNTRKMAKKEMAAILQMDGFNQTIALLQLLKTLSESKEYKLLSGAGFNDASLNDADANRINRIYQYVIEHFKGTITLDQVAKLANMTPQAFCKYFKLRTKKTFSSFLNEVKVSYACRLLIENNLSILQICYESGFNNLSNFNRQFKRITKLSPTEYIGQSVKR